MIRCHKLLKTFLIIPLFFLFVLNSYAQITNFKSFSVDQSQTLDGKITGYGKYYYVKDKRRNEGTLYLYGGKIFKTIIIIRMDKQIMWILNPEKKTYTERSWQSKGPAKGMQDIRMSGVEKPTGTLVGTETIDGQLADKYIESSSFKQGPLKVNTKITSYYVHGSMIPIKVEIDMRSDDGNMHIGVDEYKNIQFNEPPAELFEIPAGYKLIQNQRK